MILGLAASPSLSVTASVAQPNPSFRTSPQRGAFQRTPAQEAVNNIVRRNPVSEASGGRHARVDNSASAADLLPFVHGSSGPSQATTRVEAPATLTPRTSAPLANMARHRSVTSPQGAAQPSQSALDWSSVRLSLRRNVSGTTAPAPATPPPQLPVSQLPSLRLVPYQDPRSTRPSLNFATTTRILPNTDSIIRVGRYSERESGPTNEAPDTVSDAPVGFKSKVVSRRHCEFFYKDNQWFIKDVKSSSGTFLNHIRLSPPGEESRPFAIKDGDLIQLGIDFKGGEEMIFRCVKIRILCNRGWQKSVNKFNKSAHKHLHDLQRSTSASDASKTSTECTICLNSIAPCQSLFVAPCSHTWHYKCIRPMLDEVKFTDVNEWHFVCPNCRNVADLNADVDEPIGWESDDDSIPKEDSSEAANEATSTEQGETDSAPETPGQRRGSARGLNPGASDFVPAVPSRVTANGITITTHDQPEEADLDITMANTPPVAIAARRDVAPGPLSFEQSRLGQMSFDPDIDGPLTPRNTAGPFVFDGGSPSLAAGLGTPWASIDTNRTSDQSKRDAMDISGS